MLHIRACCKIMFSRGFRCFIHVLQMFYLDVAYILRWLHTCFQVFLGVCKCFSCFRSMLQLFHLDVVKVGLVLHMLQWDPPVAAACSCWGAAVGDHARAWDKQSRGRKGDWDPEVWHAEVGQMTGPWGDSLQRTDENQTIACHLSLMQTFTFPPNTLHIQLLRFFLRSNYHVDQESVSMTLISLRQQKDR
jgi:hypothetical protein